MLSFSLAYYKKSKYLSASVVYQGSDSKTGLGCFSPEYGKLLALDLSGIGNDQGEVCHQLLELGSMLFLSRNG